MGIIQNLTKQNSPQKNEENFSLNKAELEFLLLLVKRSTFVGEQIEDVYNVVYKLQQQYLQKILTYLGIDGVYIDNEFVPIASLSSYLDTKSKQKSSK